MIIANTIDLHMHAKRMNLVVTTIECPAPAPGVPATTRTR